MAFALPVPWCSKSQSLQGFCYSVYQLLANVTANVQVGRKRTDS